MDIQSLSVLFPVTSSRIYLSNAAESPLNTLVKSKLDAYFNFAAIDPLQKPNPRLEVKKRLAALLGGQVEEYALVTSTGMGIGIAALGIDWQVGDNVVLPEGEHWNNTFPWLALKDKGVEVRLVPLDIQNRVNTDAMRQAVDSRTRLLAVAAVRFNSGHRPDLKTLSQIAHAQNALFLVDGIQAAGVVPLNVYDDGIDILTSGGFKWLLGLPGTGFLYVKSEIQHSIKPALPGMFAAENLPDQLNYFDDARRYETGSIAYSLFYAWQAGLDLLLELGIEAIHRRVLDLTDQLIEGFKEKNIQILTPIDKVDERSAILTFTLGSPEANEALFHKLSEEKIDISLRSGICRISPSFFNTVEEIERFLHML